MIWKCHILSAWPSACHGLSRTKSNTRHVPSKVACIRSAVHFKRSLKTVFTKQRFTRVTHTFICGQPVLLVPIMAPAEHFSVCVTFLRLTNLISQWKNSPFAAQSKSQFLTADDLHLQMHLMRVACGWEPVLSSW
jgi:hypothetical protein